MSYYDETDEQLCMAYGHQDQEALFEDDEIIVFYCRNCGMQWTEDNHDA